MSARTFAEACASSAARVGGDTGVVRASVMAGSAVRGANWKASKRPSASSMRGLVAVAAVVDPGPLLDQEPAAGAVGLEVDRRGDAVADEDRQGEVAELPFRGRDIGLEAVVVVEEGGEALALDDERVEGREDVDAVGLGQRLRRAPRASPSAASAPSIATGTSRRRRTRASISAAIAFLRGASM